jgi:hypothetical protein
MTSYLPLLTDAEMGEGWGEAGVGTVATERGNLPLQAIDVDATLTGLVARVALTQTFGNRFDQPLEASYIFPLPDRAAVTGFRMEVGERVVEGVLKERGQARADYDAPSPRGEGPRSPRRSGRACSRCGSGTCSRGSGSRSGWS